LSQVFFLPWHFSWASGEPHHSGSSLSLLLLLLRILFALKAWITVLYNKLSIQLTQTLTHLISVMIQMNPFDLTANIKIKNSLSRKCVWKRYAVSLLGITHLRVWEGKGEGGEKPWIKLSFQTHHIRTQKAPLGWKHTRIYK
jgi:hypothetical protein